jgi:Flp pilus assembly protein TadD
VEGDNPAVAVRVADLLGAMGRFDEADKELRRAQRLAPDDPDVRVGVALLLFRRGLYAEADEHLRWVCERDPEHAEAQFYRGEAQNRLARVEEAIEALQEAIRLEPDNPRAYHTLGILFDRKHLPQQAARMYRRARELSGR